MRADRPLRPPPGGRRAGLAVPRRPRPVALLRRRRGASPSSSWPRSSPGGRARPGERAGSASASPTGASPPASPLAGPAGRRWSSPPATSPAFLGAAPGGVAARSSARSTPSSSGCSPAWAWPASGTSPRCPPVTSSPASDRPVATPTASPAGSTIVWPAGPSRQPERRVEQTFDDPVVQLEPLVFVGKQLADSSSPRWPPRGGCAPASS